MPLYFRTKEVHTLIKRFIKQSPKSRGPLLAQIDFSANLCKRGIQHSCADETFCKDLIRKYLELFGGKQICALDIAYAIPLLIKDHKKRQSVNTLLCPYFKLIFRNHFITLCCRQVVECLLKDLRLTAAKLVSLNTVRHYFTSPKIEV